MTRILTSDILIADVITPLESNSELQNLVDKYDLKPGGKVAITREQFEEFSRAVQGSDLKIEPGGSSANMLTTLAKLDPNVQVDFLGVVGKGMYSGMIKGSLDEAGVNLLPEKLPESPMPEAAVSFVITYPDGQRTIATYPGNAKQLLSPEMVTDELVEQSDVLMVQGSLWQKMTPEFANELMKKRWEHDKELWLALPTNAKFGEENAETFKWLLTSANVVFSNDEELARIYHRDFKTDPDTALYDLCKTFQNHDPLSYAGKSQRREQVAFITRGDKGAAIVTEKGVQFIPPADIDPSEIKNTLGAGDTSFAGFAAGHLAGLSHETSALLAMRLAVEKLKHNRPRLKDPAATLQQAAPQLFGQLERGQGTGRLPEGL